MTKGQGTVSTNEDAQNGKAEFPENWTGTSRNFPTGEFDFTGTIPGTTTYPAILWFKYVSPGYEYCGTSSDSCGSCDCCD